MKRSEGMKRGRKGRMEGKEMNRGWKERKLRMEKRLKDESDD